MFRLCSVSSSFRDLHVSIRIISSTVIKMYLEFIFIMHDIKSPRLWPRSGIIKWHIPTSIEVRKIVFLGMFKIPYVKDSVNASMLSDNPIIINDIISKKSHLYNYRCLFCFYSIL